MTLASGDSHPATAIGRDAANDLAVIRIADARPRPATFADSSQVQVGDITLALWNPLGLRSSVTEGIVSAVRRSVPERSPGLSRTRADPAEYDGRCNAESLCSAGAVAQRVARRPTTTAHPAANVQSLIASCPASWRRPSEISPTQRSKHMTRSRPITLLAGAALMPLTALAVAACGGGDSATAATKAPTSAATKAPKSAASHAPTVRVAKTRLGKALVDSRGRTLYLFTKDSGMKSACSGACAIAWPPLRASGKPTVSGGAKASLVGTTKRSDGKLQVTYNGHPLYSFVKDTKSGDTNGEGLTAFGGSWFAVSPAGKRIANQPSRSGGGSSSSRPAAPAAPPAPKKAPQPAAPAAPKSSPAPKKPPSASNGIPQNNGGDQDSDNNGGPDDGDGGI